MQSGGGNDGCYAALQPFKPGRLDPKERLTINAHSFETFQILRHIKGFEEIARWASYHHEEPDGSGYPFHAKGEDMPLEARILRVADTFQTVGQHRPYRPGLNGVEVHDFMGELVAWGRVDGDVVASALDSLDEAMQVACPLRGRLPA